MTNSQIQLDTSVGKFKERLFISMKAGVIYFMLNSKLSYQLTETLVGGTANNECPTSFGRMLHMLLFFSVTLMSMYNSDIDILLKIKFSLYGTLIAFFVSSTEFNQIVGRYITKEDNSISNCFEIKQMFVHTLIYIVFLVAVMYLPDEKQ